MKRFLWLFFGLFLLVSCNKDNRHQLDNSNWNTFYKYDGFDFFAEKELHFNKDKTCYEFGKSTDKVYGTWQVSDDNISIELEDKTKMNAKIISNDSMVGFRTSNGNISGQWIAKRK